MCQCPNYTQETSYGIEWIECDNADCKKSVKLEEYSDTCKRIADKIRHYAKYHEELKEDEE